MRAWLRTDEAKTYAATLQTASTALGDAKDATGRYGFEPPEDLMVVTCHRAGQPSRLAYVCENGGKVRVITVLTKAEKNESKRDNSCDQIIPGVTPATFTPLCPGGPLRLQDWRNLVTPEPEWTRQAGCLTMLLFGPAVVASHFFWGVPWLAVALLLIFAPLGVGILTVYLAERLSWLAREPRLRANPQERDEVRLRDWIADPPGSAATSHERLNEHVRQWTLQNVIPD